jgi:hypothetical protein
MLIAIEAKEGPGIIEKFRDTGKNSTPWNGEKWCV